MEKDADDSAGADNVEPDLLAEAQQAALWDGAPVEEPVLLAESEDEGVGDEEGVEEGFTPPPGSEDSPSSSSAVSRGEPCRPRAASNAVFTAASTSARRFARFVVGPPARARGHHL